MAFLVGTTILGVIVTMAMFHYCMHKGWNIREMKHDTYRDTQLQINIHHENERVFIDNNDFVQHKAQNIDHSEEELDNCNLDIQ
jgi:hypothetical protein